MRNDIGLSLALLKAGIKCRAKSYSISRRRKIVKTSVIILVHGSSWLLVLFGLYKMIS
jgi:hypothetical protein